MVITPDENTRFMVAGERRPSGTLSNMQRKSIKANHRNELLEKQLELLILIIAMCKHEIISIIL